MKKNIYQIGTIKVVLIVLLSLSFYSCKTAYSKIDKEENSAKDKISQLRDQLNNPTGKDILVIAHRSDWRNFPENSLEAMESAINMGVDMIEIDVAKTKDNQLIIMHDRTLDRTTTGSGLVADKTLEEIKQLHLKNGIDIATKYKIPTLEEVLLSCKGKILINLDKTYEFFDQAFELAKQTGTTHQIVMKGYDITVDKVIADFGVKLDTITFMPIINLDKQANPLTIIDDFQTKLKVKAFEIVFSKENPEVLNQFSAIKSKGSRVWVNSLWGELCANHEDNLAVNNPDAIYGWYINKGVNMIQTDRPELLLKYLRSKGLHQ